MIKKDKLKPTQPYFVLDTTDFVQKMYLKDGISHFYNYKVNVSMPYRAVPDGCIDILFEITNSGDITGYACGTCLSYKEIDSRPAGEIFGVRFMPGIQPAIISARMKELVENRVELSKCLQGDGEWIKLIKDSEFEDRVEIFLGAYEKARKAEKKPYGKSEIVQSIKNLVYASDGQMKINDIAERTGYTERYINKIFQEEMGFSPKLFCKIIQFQRAIELLNYGKPENMTEAAVYLGYYDQPQFIRDFSKFAGMTPRRYLDLIEKGNYRNRVKSIN